MENPSHYSFCSIIDTVSPVAGWMIFGFLCKWQKRVKFLPHASSCIGAHTCAHTQKKKAIYQTFNTSQTVICANSKGKVRSPEQNSADFSLAFRWDSLASLFSTVWHLQNFSVESFLWTSLQSPANLPEITGNFNNNENDANFDFRSIFDECYPCFFFIHLPWFMSSHLSHNAETIFASDFIHQVLFNFLPFLASCQ